jgi:hypothetical protein
MQKFAAKTPKAIVACASTHLMLFPAGTERVQGRQLGPVDSVPSILQ